MKQIYDMSKVIDLFKDACVEWSGALEDLDRALVETAVKVCNHDSYIGAGIERSAFSFKDFVIKVSKEFYVDINDEIAEDDFNQWCDEEDEDKEYGPTVQEIQKMYPELSLNFINNTFEQNDKFNEEYVGNVKVEHHISFQDESDLNIFIDVCKDNKYEVEKDGTSVKVISKFTNEKGSIMSDIFNVANQSLLLNGQYLGYKIEVEK